MVICSAAAGGGVVGDGYGGYERGLAKIRNNVADGTEGAFIKDTGTDKGIDKQSELGPRRERLLTLASIKTRAILLTRGTVGG